MKNANLSLHPLGSAVHAAKRAADIIFILQSKERSGNAALGKKVREILKVYGEQNPELNSADIDELKKVSQELYAVFATKDVDDAAGILNLLLNRYASAPRLSAHAGTPWHLHVDSNDHAPWAEWFAASSALALASLLAEKQRNPGGLCASPSCGRPYIDQGKGGGRSYCSPRCATRERVAAYRKTRKTPTNSQAPN
ncbi:MAG TPA: CGNR zinc finger domain-containing protein [Candidatus Saccharimonadales bacterium]|nr:CGNR zinc finger domain-containing protein [Candidatus Saccharimonadales bacterium]